MRDNQSSHTFAYLFTYVRTDAMRNFMFSGDNSRIRRENKTRETSFCRTKNPRECKCRYRHRSRRTIFRSRVSKLSSFKTNTECVTKRSILRALTAILYRFNYALESNCCRLCQDRNVQTNRVCKLTERLMSVTVPNGTHYKIVIDQSTTSCRYLLDVT